MKLVDLNDDCLVKIMKHLDFGDHINLQLASDRFSELTDVYLEREEFQFGYFKKKFSLAQAESLLSQFGFRIKRLTHNYTSDVDWGYKRKPYDDWGNEFKPYKDLLVKYCPNIEELDISYKNDIHNNVELLITLKDKLKVLKAVCSRLTDKECSIIGKLTRLEFLDLSVNTEITGKYLSNFKKLKYLNISYCFKFQSEIFNKLSHNNHFESLKIENWDPLNDHSLKILLQTQSDCLRELNISFSYPKVDVAVLMKLKTLRIAKINAIWSPRVRSGQGIILKELARLHGDDLESLELSVTIFYKFSDEDLANILKFKNLKKLSIFTAPLQKEFVCKLTKSSLNLENLALNVEKEVVESKIISRLKKLKYKFTHVGKN